MKKYVTPALKFLIVQTKDIVTLSVTEYNDNDAIVYEKDSLKLY